VRDREVEVGAAELLERAAGPALDDVAEALAQREPLHDAAVVEDGRRHAAVAADELGEVARDGRVGGVGQPGLLEAGAAAAGRGPSGRASAAQVGKKPSTSAVSTSGRSSSVLIVPPMTFEPRPSTATGALASLASARSASLAARQARVSERCCQASSLVPFRA